VQDDGVGFDPSQLQAQVGGGTGFGLFNIRERLRYLGGQLGIESQLGQGARLTLTVPLSPEEQTVEV
jgi:signal transduction histidine kinase